MADTTQYAAVELIEQGTDTRIIAGTTTDLSALSAEGRFNADLFYRLDVMRVRIPALSERPEDIPIIFRRYVAQAAELGLAEQMARVERSLLVAALGRHNGKAAQAAQALKLPRKTFYDKLAKYAIRPETFRR